jgi:hypothetical protein
VRLPMMPLASDVLIRKGPTRIPAALALCLA